ncbi:hypothetical protein [Streptomyces sp. FR-008]|uniref:hypothetical protein n=1 Tax=Streptomyces sp. FR-008 TaxID=206662 RepID=UPI0007210B6E|nr:hypothetical protein [Streptomyces sp. FR-008]ALM43561.1 hypothetical protein SFR_6946 [Streptomyces sp. FR-008]KAF0794850.1 hypothetical protein P405_17215 [Streptomyces sp. FR-008]
MQSRRIPTLEELSATADRQRAGIDSLALANTHSLHGPGATAQQAQEMAANRTPEELRLIRDAAERLR